MARIIISTFSNVTWTKEKYHDSFVEGFANALKRCGNQVLMIRTNEFVDYPVTSKLKSNINKKKLLKSINNFNPELIITFNNSFPCEEFITRTSCPIILYTADGCDFFAFKDLIKKYQDRYVFFNLNESIYTSLNKHYPFIKESQYCYFGYATDFQAKDIEQDINISFLGSIPNYTYNLAQYFIKESSNEIKEMFFNEFDIFKQDVFSHFNVKLPNFKSETLLETLAIFLLTTKDRFEILSELTDLGLAIYGYDSFCLAGIYNYELLKAYNFDLCVTIEQSQILFNRSKISLNLPNARATCGFSWRVPDILASNSVLLSPDKKDLKTLMQGYAELPTFNSPAEAKDIAGKLLKDDVLRKELSQASKKMINDKCRFELKFKTMQEHLKINLFPDNIGSIKHLDEKEFFNIISIKSPKQNKILRETSKALPYFVAKKILQRMSCDG